MVSITQPTSLLWVTDIRQDVYISLYLRLQPQNVRNTVRLVSGLIRFGIDTTNIVHKMYSGHPLVNGQLDLAGEVVEMPYQRAQNLSVARRDIGAHRVEHMLSESGIESRRLRSLCGVGDAGIL